MEIGRYIDELRDQLLVAADAGGDDARLLAERLIGPLESAARLVLLDALSAAAGEITSELAPGSVEVRLRGREPEFVVAVPRDHEHPTTTHLTTSPTMTSPTMPADARLVVEAPVAEVEDGGTSRITLRLPEQLKVRIEDAAGRAGVSVNSWLVRTIAEAVDPAEAERRPAAATTTTHAGGQHFTGWAR